MSKAPAVDYALRITELFSKSQGAIGISDICNTLNINKNAASRVLEALLEYNWIYLSDPVQKKYRFTLKPFSLISKCTPQYALAEIAEGELKEINRMFGDAVYLGVLNGDNVLYLLHYDSSKEVRINGRTGGEYPANLSAPGKVLLSFGKHGEEFNADAENIKKNGYAVDDEGFARGVICVAVPVYDSSGKVVASVGISSLTIYDTVDSLVSEKLPALQSAAKCISEKMGYGGY